MREKRRDIGGILRRAIVDSHLIIGVLCFVLYDHSQGPAEQQSAETPVHVAIGEPRIAENGDKRRGIRIVSEIQALSHLHVIVSQFLARGKVGNLVIDGRKEFVRIDIIRSMEIMCRTCSAKNLDLASSNSVADLMFENANPLLRLILVIGTFGSRINSLLMSFTPQ